MTGIKNAGIRALAALIAFSALGNAEELRPETVDGWRNYLQIANARLQGDLRARNLFLRADEISGMCAKLRHGDVVVAPGVGSTPTHVPFGLIHDWMASAFFPGVRVGDVLRVLRSYGEFPEIYKPTVIEVRELGESRDRDEFSMIFRNRSLMSHTAIEGDYEVHYTQLDEKRWYSIAYTKRLQEIENYGRPEENKLNAGTGSGYIWRLCTIERFEERDGGVYVEIEAIALSRDIPGSLRWMIDPMIRHISKSTLTSYVCTTRDAVLAKTEVARENAKPQPLPSGSERLPGHGAAAAFRKP